MPHRFELIDTKLTHSPKQPQWLDSRQLILENACGRSTNRRELTRRKPWIGNLGAVSLRSK